MNIDIRSHILKNFKDANEEDIENSIVDSIQEGDDVTLPGLGVFFELLWTNSSKEEKKSILNKLKNNI